MMTRRPRLFLYVLSSSLFVLGFQGFPLFILAPRDYGFYSLVQLAVILCISMSLAFITEAEARYSRRTGKLSSWASRSAAIVALALTAGSATLTLSYVFQPLRSTAVLWAIVGAASVYREAASYFLAQDGRLTRLTLGRLLGSILMMATFLLASQADSLSGLALVGVVQVAGVLMSVVFTRIPTGCAPGLVLEWIRVHKVEIRGLVFDSALQDIGSFWAPNAIAIVLNISSLGVYRAGITVASPVGLMIAPVRPLLVTKPLSYFVSRPRLLAIWVGALIVGALSALALGAIKHVSSDVGSITALYPFRFGIALFVAGTAVSHLLAVMARIHLPIGVLLSGRIAQACLLGIIPVAGGLLYRLPGAMLGLGIGSISVGLTWSLLLRFEYRRSLAGSKDG